MTRTTRWVLLGAVGALLAAGAGAYLWARAYVRRSPSIIHPDEPLPTPRQ
ncbi:hypothetical protein OWM54_35590 [Myxococcus sp. MISCRS1]|nr:MULTISPECIES: hypothetical protein [unclassified Myxococcus]MBZ4401907.1 hypothetical protein [Myxococcus sp. AS-1-15]MBZ4407286.1 hypothetical protein [Myxococcus sp. XM-1-1-1]MCY1002491.1 hypothetical protein [Myxococcus sp. MISCRS1]BDT35944.1 hypothetical protein MFMH1_56130 [Myxococcus sp. MH1]